MNKKGFAIIPAAVITALSPIIIFLLIIISAIILLFGGTSIFFIYKMMTLDIGPLPLWGAIIVAVFIFALLRRRN